ncbi:YesL family protein [Isoptericola sp. NPDC019571]|uniref:YesL family protein n=1 Tax=Isoptericola sp. NPDC019571 TaxID=3364008 RepID=UPI0037B988A9
MAQLNAMWIAFALLGGVVFGVAPASVAAARCVREHEKGRLHRPAVTFAQTWRSEFLGANLTLLPHLLVLAVLAWNYAAYSVSGPQASTPRLATLAGLLMVSAVGCWLPSLYVHYDVSRARFLVTAVRLTLSNPLPSVLLLFVLSVLTYASQRLPVLLLVITFGAWLYVSTWLGLRTFADNEARLARRADH